MPDVSPKIKNAAPASREVTIPNNTAQPVPLSKQQPLVPTEFRHCPVLPAGWALIDVVRDGPTDGIAVLSVAIGGKPHEWRFNKLTGDGELRPLY